MNRLDIDVFSYRNLQLFKKVILVEEEDKLTIEIEKKRKSKRRKRGPYRKSFLAGRQQKIK